MSTQSHLAPELLEQIFYLLPPTTQRVCLLVCKNWYTTVKPIYFSRISLLPYTNLSKVITGLQTTGDFVQSLTIEKNIQVTQEGLIRLITSCPSLLQLHAVSLYFKWVWLDGLELKRLNSVSIVGERFWTTPESYRYFYRVAYQHRGSIEDLHIPCTGDQELQDGFDGIIKYLSCFEKLKHLTLIDKYGHGPVVYFDTLLNTCKTLETLVIKLGHPLYSPTTVSNEQTITPFPSMRRLDIFLEGFSAEYLQYIIDRFVNITELDVFIRQSNMHWNRDKQKIFYFIHHKYIPFAKKALSVSSLTIYIEESTETGDLAAELFTTFRDIKKVCFEIDQGGLSATKIKLKTKQESTCTDLTLKFFCSSNPDYPKPYIKHLTAYGHLIKSLVIESSQLVDFNLFLHNCRSLEKLSIITQLYTPRPRYKPTLEIFKPTHHVLYSTLLDITIFGGSISPDFIVFLSSHVPNLKTLHIIDFTFELGVKTTCILDMAALGSLEEFVLDAQHVNQGSCRITCFKIVTPNCRTGYYLTEDHNNDINMLLSQEEIPSKAVVITLRFNSLIKIVLRKGDINYCIRKRLRNINK